MNTDLKSNESLVSSPHSVTTIDSSTRQFNDKIVGSNKKNDQGPTNHQNENSRNQSQLASSTNNSSENNLSTSLVNQSTSLTVKFQSKSRENLDQIHHPHHHQSHTNLSNISSTNNYQSSSSASVNPSINALIDLPLSRETYKSRKKLYQQEKKKLAEQLLSRLNDPTMVELAEWLKVRATFKAWTKVWCELRPGLLVIYKSPKVHKSGQWIGTILLNICNVIERPSKKGFCFKLFSPVADQNIWAKQGPKGENYGALTLPLPMTYLMFRTTGQVSGSHWMRAINLSFQSSKQLIRNDLHSNKDLKLNTEILNSLLDEEINVRDEQEIEQENFIDQDLSDDRNSSAEHEYNRSSDSDTTTGSIENDYTGNHLKQHRSDERQDDKSSTVKKRINKSCQNIVSSHLPQLDIKPKSNQPITLKQSPSKSDLNSQLDQTEYVYDPEEHRFNIDEHNQPEDVVEENKSLLWSLLKQVRPGDLSKIVLPTFILEPRSFLDKLTDYYYHCDILASATHQTDPFERMKEVVKWYVSGMYKKPNGLKKPYNPLLGEQFRCYFEHPCAMADQKSSDKLMTKTFYVAEQISHHPPISAFFIANRNQGYSVSGVVKVSSNYYGNLVSAVLDGNVRLNLINLGEQYMMSMPYAHCNGILFGTLTYELGGSEMNLIYGKIKLGNETIATIDGHWDKLINIREKRTDKSSILWQINSETVNRRLKRYVVPLDKQHEFESTNLWKRVSEAIKCGDQKAATVEKTKLEDRQRKEAKYRLENNIQYQPKLFKYDPLVNEWYYIYEDKRPWDGLQIFTKLSSALDSTSYSNMTGNQPTAVQKANAHKRSPKARSKNEQHNRQNRKSINNHLSSNQDSLNRKSETRSFFDKFDSVDEEEDTDYSSNTARKSNRASKLFKRIEQNESDIKKSILNLETRQQKLEQIVIEQRQKLSNRSIIRSIFHDTNSQFLSIPNILTILILTVAIQLIIYKFNNSSRK